MLSKLVHASLIVLGYSIFEDSQLEEVEEASSELSSLISEQDESDREQGLVEVLSKRILAKFLHNESEEEVETEPPH